MSKLLCFAIMPFGTKKDAGGKEINFDKVYETLIKPAIIKADLEPIRADEEKAGGFIHKPMYERLLFCEFAVADLSAANANVLYEVGMRHAIKPYTTVNIFDAGTVLPFDVRPLRAMPYEYAPEGIVDLSTKVEALASLIRLNMDNAPTPDSPLQQTIEGFTFPDLSSLAARADTFREWARDTQQRIDKVKQLVKEWQALYNKKKWEEIKRASLERDASIQQITNEQDEKIKAIWQFEATIHKNMMLEYNLLNVVVQAYRSAEANQYNINLLEQVPPETLKQNIFLRQQLAHAYNQVGRLDEAENILVKLIDEYGNDPETNGLLGSTYRRKAKTIQQTSAFQAEGFYEKSIIAYKAGFDTNPADYYPGINLLNLLFTTGYSQEWFEKYIPLVAYAIERKVQQKPNDYWALASGMELEVLRNNQKKVKDYLMKALACEPPPWEKRSSYDSLKRIYEQKQKNKEQGIEWIEMLLGELGK